MSRAATDRLNQLEQIVVTSSQIGDIEARIFADGMPVAALMEKVGHLIVQRIEQYYPCTKFPSAGILAGPGHNGGDALVVARELHSKGYHVQLYRPLKKRKN